MHFFSSLNFSKLFILSVRFVSTRSGKVTFVPDAHPVAPNVPTHVPSYNQYTPNANPVLGESMSLHDLYPLDNPAFYLNLTCDSLTNITENSFNFLRNGVMTGGLRGVEKTRRIRGVEEIFSQLEIELFQSP